MLDVPGQVWNRWDELTTEMPKRIPGVRALALAALLALATLGGSAAVGSGRGEQGGAVPSPQPVLAGTPSVAASAAEPLAEFLWMSATGPDGPLAHASGLAVDPRGNLWVTGGVGGGIVIFSPVGAVLETWGTRGDGEGQFNFTCGSGGYGDVAFDTAGNIYVADAGNGRIQKFGPDRAFLTSWASSEIVDTDLFVTSRANKGVVHQQPTCPVSIAIDSQGRVIVSDQDAGEIVVFDADGQPLTTMTAQSMGPEGVAVDGDDNIWVADTSNRVQMFSPDGTLQATWEASGSGDERLRIPMGIAVDAQGRVFISDQSNRVKVFTADGAFVGAWGALGGEGGQFNDPVGLELDGAGNLYVVEHYGQRVQKFRLLPPLA